MTMRSILCVVTIGVAVAAGGCAPRPSPNSDGAAAQLSDLRKDWLQQKDGMMKIADAMPEDKFGYRPTPAQRTYGEQIMHVAVGNVAMFQQFLGGKAVAPSFTTESATTKTQILKALSDSYDYGTAVLGEQTAVSINDVRDMQYFGPSTRGRIVWSLLSHAMDIYGQMAVYLRLNGIVPPASRGI
jgi:uncharacterized damage-inducible protein DinB